MVKRRVTPNVEQIDGERQSKRLKALSTLENDAQGQVTSHQQLQELLRFEQDAVQRITYGMIKLATCYWLGSNIPN